MKRTGPKTEHSRTPREAVQEEDKVLLQTKMLTLKCSSKNIFLTTRHTDKIHTTIGRQ